MTEPAAFQDIAENLSFLDDWEDRLNYLIELGQALPPMDDADKTDENKVRGCVSNVWLVSDAERASGTPVLTFRGQSDAIITKGLVAVLIALYSGRPAAEIAETDAIEWFRKLGLSEHLGMQRSNGLVAMVNRMRNEARAALV
ncbi:SufE family protein [Devosia sp. 63-57]|mgnify:CR=1 FL=1|uniref:SufE family protein n=1 Tax=Devosia sp. 63-57 TaxID=1895751 RepID=UPI00086D67BE|nr:SufE family protein [Devosia sp. 63-57]ODT47416.1 MAG: cysteine desufuration protein SufE [Pelagibacterium sp. SCN 63-126]ODU87092.1 MAG: cysteine desufuration protein SufE [Pelagibacterium sp. SCN 63-17]OJX42876.1 MAG: cysteine desufuration protein SufE [Devosia sp. 63-57]